MLETRDPLAAQSEILERGYRSCRTTVKKQLKSWSWLVSNVGGDNKRGIYALLAQFLKVNDLLDLESPDGEALDVLKEAQDELANAFAGECATPELAALVETCRRYDVSKQNIFEPLQAADGWIRNRKFDSFDQLDAFCASVGGSMIAALAPVLGVVRSDYELPAIAAGKTIMLTQLLANCVDDIKHGRVFLAQADMKDCEVDVSRIKLRQSTPEFGHLVRLYTSRLEPRFKEAGEVVGCLDLDGRRSIGAMLGYCWKAANKMKSEPESALSVDGVFSTGERFAIKSKHLLGMDPKLPFVVTSHDHH